MSTMQSLKMVVVGVKQKITYFIIAVILIVAIIIAIIVIVAIVVIIILEGVHLKVRNLKR